MAPTATATTTTTASRQLDRPAAAAAQPPLARSLRRPAATASTPDLGSVYAAQSRLVPPGLSRKTSLAALTPSSLASIPDVSESYALDSVLSDSAHAMTPATPARPADDVAVGHAVDVPGGMHGTVRFVGSVQGKKGTFAGIELHADYAARGKNNGDVDGVSYFTTSVPGAGIFVPVTKALRRGAPPVGLAVSPFPMTPTPSASAALRNGNHATGFTPPAPALPKLSASVGPGARAPSPQGKRPRTSLPRPDSPVRRTQMTPGPRPSIGTPARAPSRYGSPTNRLAQSVRGTAGDPSKKLPSKFDRKPSLGPRSISVLGSTVGFENETAVATPAVLQRTKTNGSAGSASSFSIKFHRPASRANAVNEDEIERLRSQLEDRDRQLKEQATTLAEMESSLSELQTLIEHPDGPKPKLPRSSNDDKDAAQLRHMLREKNDKIAMLTAEFDAHRADFRSTIDTLEMASAETERVYEKRIEELMADLRELESRNVDVDSVASQLKQLEELVQELEEGLEDARRGEAEARGEAEFLRGEVERTRSELRRERERAGSNNPNSHGDAAAAASKELEQKEDEIRGLKAIIHSLSRDSVPGGDGRAPTQRSGPSGGVDDSAQGKMARDNLERQVAELQALLDKQNTREEELEQELEMLRGGGRNARGHSRSSYRDSRDTIIPVRPHGSRSPAPEATHRRGTTLDTMHESDRYSTATETSTLWCEICETSGHDILTCTNMFGPDGAKSAGETRTGKDVVREGLRAHEAAAPLSTGDAHPPPLSPTKSKTPVPGAVPAVKILPNPMESGPVVGKESGVMDPDKWCAVCERDGHDSVDCPFEDAF